MRPVSVLQPLADPLGELGMGVEARADGGPAERDLAQPGERSLDAGDPLAHLRGVAAELLAQRHGHGVHKVRAARLHDVVELLRLPLERGREGVERRQQVVRRLIESGEVNSRREDVVRRLAHVHVVVGVDVLACEGRDHLVRVHVRRSARAGLEDVDRKLVVELARGNAIGGGRDALGLIGVEQAQLGVGARGGGLDPAQPAGDRRWGSAGRRRGSSRPPCASRRPRARPSRPLRRV